MKIKDVNISNAYIVRFVRSHFRSHKQLLILSLAGNAQLSLWQQIESQQQESVWQEEQDTRALEPWLRDMLLAHDVEEGISMLIVLGDALLQTEQLTLPKLPAKQLKKTLAWEVQQLFNLPQGSYSFCYKILAANAEAGGQRERVSGQQEAEQQVLQLWTLGYARQAEYAALAQRLMVKLAGLCVGAAVKQWQTRRLEAVDEAQDDGMLAAKAAQTKQLEAAEEEVQNDDLLAASVAQSWFAGEALLLLPAVPKRISWQQCYERCEKYLPLAAKLMTACACFAFMSALGLRYLAQEDLAAVQQQAGRYAVWQERQKESAALEKRVAGLKQQAEKRNVQSQASRELERWGRLGVTDVYLTELEYKAASKQGRQQSVTVAQGVAGAGEALDNMLDKLQAGKQYSSVQLVESRQQSAGVSFKLQLSGGQQ